MQEEGSSSYEEAEDEPMDGQAAPEDQDCGDISEREEVADSPSAQEAPAAPALSMASPAPTADDIAVADARKLVLRALDSKISQQEDGTALAAMETASKLVANILDTPSDPRYRRFRANNPAISKKLLRCPGGVDLILALGFRTHVHEFEEVWTAEDSHLLMRRLSEGQAVLSNYVELTRKKIERTAALRQQKLAGQELDRMMTLRAIEEDKSERRDRQTDGRKWR